MHECMRIYVMCVNLIEEATAAGCLHRLNDDVLAFWWKNRRHTVCVDHQQRQENELDKD